MNEEFFEMISDYVMFTLCVVVVVFGNIYFWQQRSMDKKKKALEESFERSKMK